MSPPEPAESGTADEDASAPLAAADTSAARVHMPLPLFERLRARARGPEAPPAQAPPVILGESHYDGRAVDGALALTLRLSVTLGAPGTWKTVPLVGEEVVVARAAVGGKPIGVT